MKRIPRRIFTEEFKREAIKMNALKHGSYAAEAKAELKIIKNYLRETIVF